MDNIPDKDNWIKIRTWIDAGNFYSDAANYSDMAEWLLEHAGPVGPVWEWRWDAEDDPSGYTNSLCVIIHPNNESAAIAFRLKYA